MAGEAETVDAPDSLKELFKVPETPGASHDPAQDQPGEYPIEPDKPEVGHQPASAKRAETPAKPAQTPAKPAETPAKPAETPAKDMMGALAPDFILKPAAGAAPEPDLSDEFDKIEITDEDIKAAGAPKKQENMLHFREAFNHYKRQAKDLAAKIAAGPAAADPAQTNALVVKLQEDNQRLSAHIERTDYINSDAFQNELVKPRDQKYQEALQIVKDAGGDVNAFAQAMRIRGKERVPLIDEVMDGIDSKYLRSNLERAISEIDDHTRKIDSRLANYKNQSAEDRKNQLIDRQRKNEQGVEQMRTLLKSATKGLLDSGFDSMRRSDDPNFKWWNDEIDMAEKAAEEILVQATPEQAAVAARLAPEALRLWKLNKAMVKVIEEQRQEISELKGATPRIVTDAERATRGGDDATIEGIIGRMSSGLYKK